MADSKQPSYLLLSVGSILSSMVIAGFILGFAVDYFLDTTPWFMLALGILGMIGGTLKVYKLMIHPDFNNGGKR